MLQEEGNQLSGDLSIADLLLTAVNFKIIRTESTKFS